jgi:hypothetical protein
MYRVLSLAQREECRVKDRVLSLVRSRARQGAVSGPKVARDLEFRSKRNRSLCWIGMKRMRAGRWVGLEGVTLYSMC